MDVYDYLDAFGSLRPAEEDVEDFHIACGLACPDRPTWPSRDDIALRSRLCHEEFGELNDALEDMDWHSGNGSKEEAMSAMADAADAIADLIYVLIGTAITFGLPMAEIWRRVHESNMAKVKDGVRRREDGKILKGPDWTPPDVIGAIRDAMK